MTEIVLVTDDKQRYLPLLLIGDEQEDMIMRYLDRSDLYILLYNGNECAACAVTDEGDGVLEIKNISVYPQYQRKGFGRRMIDHVAEVYSGQFSRLTAGTGDSPLTVPFYESCGFVRTGVIRDFFINNYDHPIIECGVRLRDMVYFEKTID